jgi:hypothetical protein
MDDSEKKPEGNPEKNPGPTTELVRNHFTGGLIQRERGINGKFLKKQKALPLTVDLTRLMRNLLNQAVAGPDGKMSKGDKSRNRNMLDTMYRYATMEAERPLINKAGEPIIVDGKLLTEVDPKIMMAAVQAYKELMLRAYGKPSASDEELDALKKQGVKIVLIEAPPNMMNREIVEERPRETLKPKFIEGEFSEDDKDKK